MFSTEKASRFVAASRSLEALVEAELGFAAALLFTDRVRSTGQTYKDIGESRDIELSNEFIDSNYCSLFASNIHHFALNKSYV